MHIKELYNLHTHSKTPASFPGLVEFFLLLLLSLWRLVDFQNLGNTVSLLLALFSTLFLVWFLKIPDPFGFHLLKPFMVHTFRPLLFLEYFFRASVLHGIEIVKGLFRGRSYPVRLSNEVSHFRKNLFCRNRPSRFRCSSSRCGWSLGLASWCCSCPSGLR